MLIEINDVASKGVIHDVQGYMLPPEAWTLGTNVRFAEGAVERNGGAAQVFGTPGVAPHFILPVAKGQGNVSTIYWLYTSLTKGYVFDGTTHTNITRQTAGNDVNYTGAETREWNGTLLGGVPILNNGVDVPQFWSADLNVANKLANLTNWPSTWRTRCMRAFGPILMAFGVNKGSDQFPHLVSWSHSADPGTIPNSWDVDDETKDTGQTDLADVHAGIIIDALPLRGQMFIYKEGSVWRCRDIGGTFIFDFENFLETAGILAPRCAILTGDGARHVVATQDDIIIHNGSSHDSILNKRMKRYLFNQIDLTNYRNCFMFANPAKDEIGFAFPESGATNPSRAVVWNYREGELGALSERAIDFRNAAAGTVETATDETWDDDTGTWDETNEGWATLNRRKVVTANTDVTKFAAMDTGNDNLGAPIVGTLQRVGIAVDGKKRNGEWIVNPYSRKVLRRVWLKMSGGPVQVRVGFQASVEGPVTWRPAKSFNPATQRYVDFMGNGAAISIEISGSAPWRLEGYALEGDVSGEL